MNAKFNFDIDLPCCDTTLENHEKQTNEMCTKIFESIALEQVALSHILNAEGEKIQRCVKEGTMQEMLDIGKSTNALIFRITDLERTLYSKLEIAAGGVE